MSTCSYWVFTCLVNQSTPLILGSPLELHGFFFIIAGINLFAVVFVTFTLPETKVENYYYYYYYRPTRLLCWARPTDYLPHTHATECGIKQKTFHWLKQPVMWLPSHQIQFHVESPPSFGISILLGCVCVLVIRVMTQHFHGANPQYHSSGSHYLYHAWTAIVVILSLCVIDCMCICL